MFMTKLQKNHKGFSAMVSLLAVLIVVVIGVGSLAVYKHYHKTASTNSSTAPTTTKSTKTTTPSPQPTNVNTIKLPKMAIQFNVPDSLKSITFIESASTADTSVQSGYGSSSYPIAFFSVPSLETTDSCKLTSQGGLLGSVWKVPGQYPTAPTSDNAPGKLMKQFPSYYLAFREPAMPCTSDTSQSAQASTLQAALSTALATSTELK